MPNRCTKCGAVFPDGDPVILTGCPNCKWNKFLYVAPENAETKAVDAEPVNKNNLDDVLKNIDKVIESEELKAEDPIDDRVESIRIIDSGSYEVNLKSVMNNEEFVVGIKEEGQYAIDLSAIMNNPSKSKSKGKK